MSDPDEPIRSGSRRANLLLLVQMRAIAVVGQLAAIAAATLIFAIPVPAGWMLVLAAFLAASSLHALVRWLRHAAISRSELFAHLVLDVLVLTAQLYLSGGATNPFVSIYLLQVILGVVLFEIPLAAALAGLATGCYFALTFVYRPLPIGHATAHSGTGLPAGPGTLFDLHLHGMFVCFVLVVVMLVVFVGRIGANLRRRDARLEELKRHTLEEAHVVRMGLLASGAAHELGSPLSTLSVILNDWQRTPKLSSDADLAADIARMQRQVVRCKTILSGVLLSAGQIRGEGTVETSLQRFLREAFEQWATSRNGACARYVDSIGEDCVVISDTALRQVLFNILDNALEASPEWVEMTVARYDDMVCIVVDDQGDGVPDPILADLGRPYLTTKAASGRGLGLFLVLNVLRTLGGRLDIAGRSPRGARVSITLPLAALRQNEPTEGRRSGDGS